MIEFFDDYVQDFIRCHPILFYMAVGLVIFLLVLVVDAIFLHSVVMGFLISVGSKVVDWFSAPLQWSYERFAAYVDGWSK